MRASCTLGSTVTGVNSPVIVRVSLEMVITVATGCLGFVAGGLVAAGPRAYSQG